MAEPNPIVLSSYVLSSIFKAGDENVIRKDLARKRFQAEIGRFRAKNGLKSGCFFELIWDIFQGLKSFSE